MDALAAWAEDRPNAVAIRNLATGDVLTFAAWDRRSNQLARRLLERGVVTGDRVALVLGGDHSLAWAVAYLAVHKAGAVAVPLGSRAAAGEVAGAVRHAEAALVLASPDRHDVARAAAVAACGGPGGVLVSGERDGEGAWSGVEHPDDAPLDVRIDPDADADLVYTSGTTGRPKGVLISHRGHAPSQRAAGERVVLLNAAPLTTTSGSMLLHSSLRSGSTHLHLPRFSVDGWFAALRRHRPHRTFLVPAMARLLVRDERFAREDLDCLQLVTIGGAPLETTVLDAWRQRLPHAHVSFGYGMTEFGGIASPPPGRPCPPGSVGLALPGVGVRVVDESGTALPAGAVGEIVVRGTAPPRTYFRDPEATASLWRDGWLHTGDLGRIDGEGFVYVTGRSKDVIVRGGFNIHAADVEAAFASHPLVLEAAVVGVPHEVLGEDIEAWVEVAPGATVGPEELRAHCLARLGDNQVPRRIHVVASLPRNASGKVVKRELVAPAPGADPAGSRR